MEEVIERTCGNSSPHELAIHFLLRHAERRMTLTTETGDQPRAAATVHQLDTDNRARRATTAPKWVAAVVAQGAGVTETVSEDSFAARFSRAYAAARHIPAPSRNRFPAQRMSA
ncbi:MAG TPA: hypothetical protein VN043_09535 [Rhodanobacter sp.]|nr:hypothetical protein [Rhodanobacter sp.]